MLETVNNFLKKIAAILEKTIVAFDVIGMLALVILIFTQVFFRYIINASLTWSEEISRYLTCWIVFLTSGYVLGIKQHMSIDIVMQIVPAKYKFILNKIYCIAYAFFCYITIQYGWDFVNLGTNTLGASIPLNMKYVYIIIPISCYIMLFYTIVLLLETKGESK